MSRVRNAVRCACGLALFAFAMPTMASTYVVTIEQMRFNPPTLTVHRGDEVVWVNKDLVAHTASTDAKGFDSKSIAPDASWRYKVGKPGRYAYRCIFHPTMHGTLIVEPEP
ncbi:copper-binding protein [Paraburkholderia sp. CNPSo 3157]|uniref:Copper-binding protein n=1 Tax=Paraburkholderia franconis TaxID=2654983 RepID=A0A7X1N966_9BURK|nr:copper-binding protein [Paraburkholderia franconis]